MLPPQLQHCAGKLGIHTAKQSFAFFRVTVQPAAEEVFHFLPAFWRHRKSPKVDWQIRLKRIESNRSRKRILSPLHLSPQLERRNRAIVCDMSHSLTSLRLPGGRTRSMTPAWEAAYDEMASNNQAFREIVERCEQAFCKWNLSAGERIVEIGGGTGGLSVRLARMFPGCTVIYVDYR